MCECERLVRARGREGEGGEREERGRERESHVYIHIHYAVLRLEGGAVQTAAVAPTCRVGLLALGAAWREVAH